MNSKDKLCTRFCSLLRKHPVECLVLLTSVIASVPVALFAIRFGAYPISDSPDDWSQFANYIGGLVNPLIAFATLIAAVVIARSAERIEVNSVRPFGLVICGNYGDRLFVKLANFGMGPMEVIEMQAWMEVNPNIKRTYLVQLLPQPPDGVHWKTYLLDDPLPVVGPGADVRLIEMEYQSSVSFAHYFGTLREALSNVIVSIRYQDIHGNEHRKIQRKLVEFAGSSK